MRPTPLQVVKKSFQDRAGLVAKLAEMVDRQRGDSTVEEVKFRLMGLSNKKLLRLYEVEQKVREKFGDREKLLEHIVTVRKAAGLTADETFRQKLGTFSKARLLDLSRTRYGERPAKLTPEQKAAKRRGRKQKERAKSARARA